jgi:hypothetical protein
MASTPQTPRPWKLEFYGVSDGRELGSITFDGKKMTGERTGVEAIEGYDSPDDVLARYDGWSNGYVSARLAGEKRTMPQGGTRIHTSAEHAKAMKDLRETTHYVDPETGEDYDPPEVPADPTPGAE